MTQENTDHAKWLHPRQSLSWVPLERHLLPADPGGTSPTDRPGIIGQVGKAYQIAQEARL